MTRINLIDPKELCRQHLIAEYRELPRIFNLVRYAIARGERPDDPRNPSRYVLGSGHCRFFYSRLGWLSDRFSALVEEMQRRGYRVSFFEPNVVGVPPEWMGNYSPDSGAVALNRKRISERFPKQR